MPVKPLTQTKLHDEAAGVMGNCMATCVASLLEIGIDEVPAWEEMGDDGGWVDSYYAFLREQGLEADGIASRNGDTVDNLWDFVFSECSGIDGYFIVGGDTPRTPRGHAVIYKDRQMVHDPHPSREGITAVREVYLIQRTDSRPKCAYCGQVFYGNSVDYAGMRFCSGACVENWVDSQE